MCLGGVINISRYKKQATEMGKSSFALAWVMDTGSEERERGVTVDIAQHNFSTEAVDFTILDAPGHRDFVPNMIGGASMADLGVLVVDANQLESGMKGQTREHILLAHAVGLRKVVVAVNKLDSTTPAWDEGTFESVSAEVLKLLKETGFKEADISIVPCSGLSGENVAKAPAGNTSAQWTTKHYTLLQQLEHWAPHTVAVDLVQKPLRMQIADVFRGGITNPLSIAGRIRSGNVQVGDSITIQPSGESGTVKGIEVNGEGREWTVAEDIPTLHLVDIEPQHLRSGDVACSPQKPIQVIKKLTVKVHALDSLLPQQVNVHVGRLHVAGGISHLVATEDAMGQTLKKKPRVVQGGQRAVIKLVLDDGAPLEAGERVVLRAEGSTVAAGAVSWVDC
jgi:elongation factor 1 alpha-like protein